MAARRSMQRQHRRSRPCSSRCRTCWSTCRARPANESSICASRSCLRSRRASRPRRSSPRCRARPQHLRDVYRRAAPVRPLRLRRPVPAEGRADAPRQHGDGTDPGCRRPVQGNRGSVRQHADHTTMAGNDPVDQDAIAAQWEASLDSEDPAAAAEAASANELTESMALQWAAMVEDGSRDFGGGKNGGERVLSQEEIDNLLGFTAGEVNLDDHSGIRAIIDSAMVSYERLPMLEIVFDRLVRLMTTSLRNFTSDNVEVSLDRITSVRFGDYLNSIPLPAILAVFKAEEWDNFGLATVDSSLIYSIIDVLLGGRRGQSTVRVEGRPYTTIESNLVKRMIEVVLADAELAFKPLSPVKFNIDRLATNTRLV